MTTTQVAVSRAEAMRLRMIKIEISKLQGRMIPMTAVIQMLIEHWDSDFSQDKIQNAIQKYGQNSPRISELTQNSDVPELAQNSHEPQNWVALGGEKGGVALVDKADWELVSRHSWHRVERERTDGRVVTYAMNGRGVYLHTLITGWTRVDHKSGDGLDCRRANLRETTQELNMANQRKSGTYAGKPTSSRYKGVTWDRRAGKWLAQIVVKGRGRSLGRYANEADAGRAYDRAAKEAWGDFSRVNFPDDWPEPDPF